MSKTDAEVAEQVRTDEIDILVDLAGHTGDNRLRVFALKPAPIQVTWMGYCNTTGLSTIDYLLSDAYTQPRSASQKLTEQVRCLPAVRFPYRAPDYAPDVAPPPCLQKGFVTFGSFNNLAKVSDAVIAVWADLLHSVPDSKLVMKARALKDETVRARIFSAFACHDVAGKKIELRGLSPHAEMLAEYGDIDIALDPFPFTGGLTSLEALWMGVPVVTLAGDSIVSCQTGSFSTALGLETLIAKSQDEYIRFAQMLAGNPRQLIEIRQSLRERMKDSALGKADIFTLQLENTYRAMWRSYCAQSTGEHVI